MTYQDRRQLIAHLEEVRKSRVLCYFMSDRETFPPGVPGFSRPLANDAQLPLIDQMRAIGRTKRLDLFLYTRGGAVDAVWPLVTLLREYCERLTVIVPFRAHSGGTLICLGADEVLMTEAAELSPIDPTTGNQFNPVNPANPQQPLGISVEDLAAYFELAKERGEITQEPYKLEVFKELTRNVHPLAIGNVQRVYLQIRQLAGKLLSLHMDAEAQSQHIESIKKALTQDFYSHVHGIKKSEAVPLLGDWIREPTEEESHVIWDMFNAYADAVELRAVFSLPAFMGDEPVRDLRCTGALLESTELSHIHETTIKVMQRPNIPPNVQIQVPPGTPLPLVPWVTRAYDYGMQTMGWRVNSGEV